MSLEEESFGLLSLETVLFTLEETLLAFVEFFDTILLLDLVCLESAFVAFFDTNFEGLGDYFLVFLFLF